MSRPRARAYVDGFNFYYGAVKGTNFKWLDLAALVSRLLPHAEVDGVVYCTARVAARAEDPSIATRQDAYMRALQAHRGGVEVIEGHFRVRVVKGQRIQVQGCHCCGGTGQRCRCCSRTVAEIRKPEEKGSDVNLAVRLVTDAFQDAFDVALVFSNDSDLQLAVDTVRGQGKLVIVCDPSGRPQPSLHGDERRTLRAAALEACQLPYELEDRDGRKIHIPEDWRA